MFCSLASFGSAISNRTSSSLSFPSPSGLSLLCLNLSAFRGVILALPSEDAYFELAKKERLRHQESGDSRSIPLKQLLG